MLFDLERSYFSSFIILRLFPYLRVTDLESSIPLTLMRKVSLSLSLGGLSLSPLRHLD